MTKRRFTLNSFLWFLCLALLVNLGVLGLKFFGSTEITTWTPYLVLAGVLVALMTLIYSERRKDSEYFLDSTKELHRLCYEALDPKGEGTPINNRINWLSAARLLKASQKMSELISLESHQKIYIEHREHLRGQLYDLINPEVPLPAEFYAENPRTFLAYTRRDRVPIAGSSLAVLHRFTLWPEDYEDPLAGTENLSEEEIDRMITFGPRPLGNLLRRVYRREE